MPDTYKRCVIYLPKQKRYISHGSYLRAGVISQCLCLEDARVYPSVGAAKNSIKKMHNVWAQHYEIRRIKLELAHPLL